MTKDINDRIREARLNDDAAAADKKRANLKKLEELAKERQKRYERIDEENRRRYLANYLEAEKRIEAALENKSSALDLSKLEDLRSIPPIPSNSNIKRLNLSRTNISDLEPLRNLTNLNELDLSKCYRVSDISHLSGLVHLHTLNLRETNVSDVSPLSPLKKLQSLNIGATKIFDLRILSGMPGLIEGAEKDPLNSGLTYAGNWVTDPKLIEIGRLSNPERTIKAIRRFGLFSPKGQKHDDFGEDPALAEDGVRDIDSGSDEFASEQPMSPASAARAPEIMPIEESEIPSQGIGLRFAVNNNALIDFEPPKPDPNDDTAQLLAIQPVLVQSARSLYESLEGSNSYQPLADAARNYLVQVDTPVPRIDAGRLWAQGLVLERWSNTVERHIEDALLPPLENHQKAALDGVLGLHGAYILSTAQGRALHAKSKEYQQNNNDSQFSAAASAFVDALRQSSGLVAPVVVNEIAEMNALAKQVTSSNDIYAARIKVTAKETTLNLIAVIAKIGLFGSAVIATKLINGALDASVAMHGVTSWGGALIDQATNFLLANKEVFKLLAAASREDFGWLERLIRWLQSARE